MENNKEKIEKINEIITVFNEISDDLENFNLKLSRKELEKVKIGTKNINKLLNLLQQNLNDKDDLSELNKIINKYQKLEKLLKNYNF